MALAFFIKKETEEKSKKCDCCNLPQVEIFRIVTVIWEPGEDREASLGFTPAEKRYICQECIEATTGVDFCLVERNNSTGVDFCLVRRREDDGNSEA